MKRAENTLAYLNERYENLLFDYKELLKNKIIEYNQLRNKVIDGIIEVQIRIDKGDYTITAIKYNIERNSLIRGYIHKPSFHGSIPSMDIKEIIDYIEIIDSLNQPYYPLLKYREKGNFEAVVDSYSDNVKKKEIVFKGNSLEELFVKFYKANNRLRYCNGSYYKFANKELEVKYYQWIAIIPNSMSFDLYYGDGIVD
ncbi:MAG: hypothetical protein IKT40_01340 [Bacilli bacterium]|nr:hypothetical protein [Bacilli bacterium]